MTESRIRVAVVGGSFAGATVAHALFENPLLEVHVYEAGPIFSQRGAAVGLNENSMLALGHVVPSRDEVLRKAGAVPLTANRDILGNGPNAGKVIFERPLADKEIGGVNVHRGSFLRELLAPLPQDMLHAGKELTGIREAADGGSDKFEVTFADGTVELFDSVIGADGIFSKVRAYVLADYPDHIAPTPGGWWDCRALIPYDTVKATLGDTHFDEDLRCRWIGNNAFIMHDVLENRELVHCVISGVETDVPKDRKRPLTRELLVSDGCLGTWLDGPIAEPMIKLILDQGPELKGYSQWEHKSTPTYVRGRVCLMGDAAHALTPWHGAGTGQAFEDAMVLGALFREVRSVSDIEAAFRAYDAVRLPRAQRIVDSSREAGQLLTWSGPFADMDFDSRVAAMREGWEYIQELDGEAYMRAAVEKMREFLKA